jgi:hypothetical protein
VSKETPSVEGQQIPIEELGERWDLGPAAVEDENGSVVTISDDYIRIEDRLVPEWVNFKLAHGPGEPQLLGRVEVRDGVPECVVLAFTSGNDGRGLRQSDLRGVQMDSLVIDLVASLSIHVDQTTDPNKTVFRVGLGDGGPTASARRFIERRRKGPGLRDLTPELLQRVAEVYRANIGGAPTAAVAKTFGVKSRMASTYVRRARDKGYLPETTQGRKQA